jgi:predicted dehydrogenase
MAAPIKVGIVGSGFIAHTRLRCYRNVSGTPVEVAAVVSGRRERAASFAQTFGISEVCESYEAMLGLPDIDVVDLCVPNHLHKPMTEQAARKGKHIICTKPLTAYVGQDLNFDAGDKIADQSMRHRYALAMEEAQAMVDAAQAHGVRLMYGENWVYAPSISRAAALLDNAKGSILEMHGWEAHNGSHSPYSKAWRYTGGGSLLRLGAHPIGAMLFLKRKEGLARLGEAIVPASVVAETRVLSVPQEPPSTPHFVAQGWVDVENWGCVLITFSDGSVGMAYGSDVMLGGMESKLEIMASNCHVKCNLSPNNLLQTYAPSEEVFQNAYLMEKTSTSAGWNSAIPDEDWTSGQLQMIETFMHDIASDRVSDAEGLLGLRVLQVIYAAYLSASEGKRIDLSSL